MNHQDNGLGTALAKRWTHKACFDHFRVIPSNPRWSWSGRSADNQIVAVTLWQDRFLEKGMAYENFADDEPGAWRSRPGFVELLSNLEHSRRYLEGLVHVIIAIPEDPLASPRSIRECFPQPALRMRVTSLDLGSGTFRLERVQ